LAVVAQEGGVVAVSRDAGLATTNPLDLVPGLELLDVVDVVRVEELRAVDHERELGLARDHRLDAFGLLALPVRPGEQEVPRVVAGGAAADVSEVERVEVDELE
jgi:hypothetical protein